MRKTTAKLVASRVWRVWEVMFLILVALVLVHNLHGCANVTISNDHSSSRSHQDVGRVTSSDQNGSLDASVPVSLVPK